MPTSGGDIKLSVIKKEAFWIYTLDMNEDFDLRPFL